MSSYTSFAVAGSGAIGSYVVAALAANPSLAVTVLSRSADVKVPSGVVVKVVDYAIPSSIESALSGIDVVISTLGGGGNDVQEALANAAKQAGAKLFVPSEFGNPTVGLLTGPLASRELLARHLKAIGLPSLRLWTGPFSDYVLVAPFGFDFANGSATWVGQGDTPIGWTARADIASFLAHILTSLPPASLVDRIVRIEGDRKSFNEIVSIYERTHPGKKVIPTRTSIEAAQQTIATDHGLAGFVAYLFLSWEQGEVIYKSGPLDNELFPEWKPQSITKLLASYE